MYALDPTGHCSQSNVCIRLFIQMIRHKYPGSSYLSVVILKPVMACIFFIAHMADAVICKYIKDIFLNFRFFMR
jgi:hypothetical protein